jgi:hypothetical protein
MMGTRQPVNRSSRRRLVLDGGVSYTPIFYQMESSVNHLSFCFVDVLPKFKIAMFPKAPKGDRKALRVL